MAPSPDSSESSERCLVCRLPLVPSSSTAASKACLFCLKVFGRVDGARRHAKTCPSRNGRPLPREAKRGRKVRSCDACSRIKVSCNSQTPCRRCTARKLTCTYGRICTDPSHQQYEQTQLGQERRPPEKAAAPSPFPFLLSCTDPRVNFVNDVLVPGEPERDPATAFDGDGVVNLDPIDVIDPRLLFHSFMDPYFSMSLDNASMDSPCLDVDMDLAALSAPILSTVPGLPSSEDALAPRVVVLEAELLELVARQPGSLTALYAAFRTFFANADFHRLIAVFFRRQQLLAKMIHWPTFDAGQVDASLLLAIALCGVAYLQSSAPNAVFGSDTTAKLITSAAAIQPLAEKYIFKRLKTECNENEHSPSAITAAEKNARALDICQAAYLVVLLQISVNDHDSATRRRAMTKRQPALVDALRHLGMLSMRPSSSATADSADPWRTFVYHESCSRLALWVFFSDGLLALFCNAPPNTTVAEMTADFPCRDELWDAASSSLYEEEKKRDGAYQCQHSVRPLSVNNVLAALLDDGNASWQTPACQALTVFHLYSVVGAIQFSLFNYRFNALPPSFGHVLLRALGRWERLWHAALARVPPDQQRWLGVAKYAPEFALVARRIVQVSLEPTSSSGGARYLQCTPAYDLRIFHAFLLQYEKP
ncbi:hypothetical protein SCUCBS95973_000530 [Sporothrix curviconia]|uniref:Zn(2)-C6 fungal-type domain-containing protein n=1 Tax=Sporothrix curviconia TaxID=1260050 RepID=A0ABP0AR33_9PEZI